MAPRRRCTLTSTTVPSGSARPDRQRRTSSTSRSRVDPIASRDGEVRRREQNHTMGRRGRKDDLLLRSRRRLTSADERFDAKGRAQLLGLLAAGELKGRTDGVPPAKRLCARFAPSMTRPSRRAGGPLPSL